MRRLNAEINQALRDRDVQNRLAALALDPTPMSQTEFADYVKKEVAKWATIVKTAKVPLQ